MLPKRMYTFCRGESVGLEKGSSKSMEKCFDYLNRKKENLKMFWKNLKVIEMFLTGLYIRQRKDNPLKMPSRVQSLIITRW